MTTAVVSSQGQIVLRADQRKRLGPGAGATVDVLEEADGLRRRVVRKVAAAYATAVAAMASMVKAKTRGVPRGLQDFDAAGMQARPPPGRS